MKADAHIRLYETQRKFVDCGASAVAFLGGVGSGKTIGGAAKSLKYVSENALSLGMIGAPTFKMLRDSSLRSVMAMFPQRFIKYFDKSNMIISLENGAEILLRSTDDPETLRGPSLAWIWLDEAALMPAEVWKICQGRLRQQGFKTQAWITTTPKGFNWVYQEFILQDRPDYKYFRCSTGKNPFLPADYARKLLESYKDNPEFIKQEIEGEFVIVGGRPFFLMNILEILDKDVKEPFETRDCVEIWKRPLIGGKYVCGVDPSGTRPIDESDKDLAKKKGSYAVAQMLDFQTGEQVAKIRGRIPGDEMAQKVVNLCDLYNKAWCGVEYNGEGKVVINKMVELGYGDRMFHRSLDWYNDSPKRGFLTYDKTRPVILGELEEAIRRLAIRVNSKNTVSEMMSFIRDDSGKPKHAEGAYDDEVMALAIAWHMRHSALFYTDSMVIKVGSY
jgi:phage terminase large subunit